MEYVRFQTTFSEQLAGCKNPANAKYLGYIEIPVPENYQLMDNYELTNYVEETTGMFATGYLSIVERNQEEL